MFWKKYLRMISWPHLIYFMVSIDFNGIKIVLWNPQLMYKVLTNMAKVSSAVGASWMTGGVWKLRA